MTVDVDLEGHSLRSGFVIAAEILLHCRNQRSRSANLFRWPDDSKLILGKKSRRVALALCEYRRRI
jgi:hypothetical protein